MTEPTAEEATAAAAPRLVFNSEITEDEIPAFLRKKADKKIPVREPGDPTPVVDRTGAEPETINEAASVVTQASSVEPTTLVEAPDTNNVVDMARKPTEPAGRIPAEESLDDVTIEQLQAEQDEIQRRIQAKREAEKKAVIEQIVNVVKTYEIPLDELVEALGGLKVKRKGVKATQKYQDPKTGATWSGRGKEPAWIKGKKRDKFLIA